MNKIIGFLIALCLLAIGVVDAKDKTGQCHKGRCKDGSVVAPNPASEDPLFLGNAQLRPFIKAKGLRFPLPTFVGTEAEGYAISCTVHGQELPGSPYNSTDHGCRDYKGNDGKVYRITYNYQKQNYADRIFRLDKAGGKVLLVLLRDFGGPGRAIVDNTGISDGGTKAADEDKSLPTPTMPGTTEEPPASSPPQAGNPAVDAAKKAVDDLLKRLGK